MMAVMNVTKLKDLGYKALDTELEDPMDKRFRPQKYAGTNINEIKTKVLPAFAKLKAYPDPTKVEELTAKYWTGKASPSEQESGEKVIPNTDPDKMAVHNAHHGSGGMGAKETKQQPDSMSGAGQNSHHGGGMPSMPMESPSDTMMTGSQQGSHHGMMGMI